nr:MAG TPA: hypothetical protein [Caudoviricetes sp.]DAZ71540.1 MAG TPA: hypothetical protein [Caudoviricetes sp.]
MIDCSEDDTIFIGFWSISSELLKEAHWRVFLLVDRSCWRRSGFFFGIN